MDNFDIAIIGAGAAGLAAAAVTAKERSTLVIDREADAGGILRQCIHNGFGLRYFNEELTGPEFAERICNKAKDAGAQFALNTTVTDITKLDDGSFQLLLLSPQDGVRKVNAKCIFLAMGCRERNRGNIATPGTRPAGVFTAGSAQKLLNIEGCLPGKSAVIVGSGDIGLIMARRLHWCGIEVKGVVEIMPYPSGLPRNIAQCLEPFDIPLWLGHSVVRICGQDRVDGVDVAPLVNNVPDMEHAFHLDCDTVLFSVGLIPESELARTLGVEINPATGGAIVNANYETNVPGVFSGGNVLHVHDLVDFVAEESERAGQCMLNKLAGTTNADACPVCVEANLKYCVPSSYFAGKDTVFSFRPLIIADSATLTATLDGCEIWQKRLQFVRPAQMLTITLSAALLTGGKLSFKLTINN